MNKNLICFSFIAGSRLEKAIQEGMDALNRFITAGEVDQLSDIIKKPGVDKDHDEPSAKRSRFDRVTNHNVQIMYKESQSSTFIPPLMTINVEPNRAEPDYRMPPTMIGDMHGWAPAPPPGGDNWKQSSSSINQPPLMHGMNVGPSQNNNRNGPSGNFNRSNAAAGNAPAGNDGMAKRRTRVSRFDNPSERNRSGGNNNSGNGNWGKNNRRM